MVSVRAEDLPSHLPSPLETPINRAFRAESEGVRAKKEKKFFLEVDELTSQQPQAVTLANPFKIPLHRKEQRSKKSVSKTPCVIIREFF
mgnify:FL=1